MTPNYADLAVVAIILGFAVLGFINGFIMSIFRVASYFLSIFLSVKLYPFVGAFLKETPVFTGIKDSIYKELLKQKETLLPKTPSGAKQAAVDSIVENLRLPEFLKGTLIERIPDPSKLVDFNSIINSISTEITKLIIDIISLILIYIIIRITLIFARIVLEGISKLPVFKQINKTAGIMLGATEGVLTVYIAGAFLVLFISAASFKPVYDQIDSSILAKFFFQNNFIVDWMFPKGKGVT